MNLQALREICRDNQISQNEMARMLDVSNAHISNIINGKREPRVDLLKKMCETFHKKPEELW